MHIPIHQLIIQDGYFGVFLILLVEMVGIPFPAETTLTLSGIAWSQGSLSLVPLIGCAVLGNFIGSSIAYGIGYHLGRPFLLRYGRFVGIRESHLHKADQLFKKYGNPLILFAKFIAGVRVLVPYLAGMNRMSFVRFSVLNLLGALVWTTAFIVAGRYVGVAWIHYHKLIMHWMIPIVCVVVLVGGFAVFKKIKRHQTVEL